MRTRELLGSDTHTPQVLGDSRARVLAVLQDAAEPLGVGVVAERVQLHSNTTRFHLDGLVEAGLAECALEDRERPGRPRSLYSARPESYDTGQRSYRLLATILASYVAAEASEPAQTAAVAGRAWGRYLADRPPPFRQTGVEEAIRQLVRTLDEIGFAPETAEVNGERQILLRHCPFLETAGEYRDVVCSVHLGLMQGLLTELDAPVQATGLDPFVGPRLCVTHLNAQSTQNGGADS